jgi:hypothetical protein
VSFAAITLCVASQRVFIVLSVYFVIDSVRKLLDTLSYSSSEWSASRSGRFTPQGKSLCYPLDRRLGGTQNRSGRGGEEKSSQLPPGIEP